MVVPRIRMHLSGDEHKLCMKTVYQLQQLTQHKNLSSVAAICAVYTAIHGFKSLAVSYIC